MFYALALETCACGETCDGRKKVSKKKNVETKLQAEITKRKMSKVSVSLFTSHGIEKRPEKSHKENVF